VSALRQRSSFSWVGKGEAHLDKIPLLSDRVGFLVELCSRHRAVAPLGCADSPYTEERLAAGRLLHSGLAERSNVTGFDVDEEALAQLRRTFPEQHFVNCDVSDGVPSDHSGIYDLVLAAEVLEHTRSPGIFLSGCRTLLCEGGTLCVTAPNACNPKIGVRSVLGQELVHPDHFAYYSPRTLRRTLASAGFKVYALCTYFADGTLVAFAANRFLWTAHKITRGPIGDGVIALARAMNDRSEDVCHARSVASR
jgi:SAM-dependent methyltransferase